MVIETGEDRRSAEIWVPTDKEPSNTVSCSVMGGVYLDFVSRAQRWSALIFLRERGDAGKELYRWKVGRG
ncbi:MAG: hypothetical protein ACE5HK_07840, partial [Candidatus Methylomirabilales bacterium]